MHVLSHHGRKVAGFLLLVRAAAADLVEVEAFDQDGFLSWTQDNPSAVARVEWAPSATGAWQTGWSSLQHLAATGAVMTRPVPRYFRLRVSTNRMAGADMSGWETVLGDGVYAPEGVPPPGVDDIATDHRGTHSEIVANPLQRRIMAHNITFRRVIDDEALAAVHRCGLLFRLPYQPATTNTEANGQTWEAGLFVWDGGQTRLDYGGAIQWVLNPWLPEFGDILCWSTRTNQEWVRVGFLHPDTNWHELRLEMDYRTQRSVLTIDSNHFPFAFTATARPGWDAHTAARLQVEAISVYPGDTGFVHRVEIRDWYWTWEP